MLRLFFIRSKLTPPSAYPEQKPAEPESGGSAKETERRPKARGIEAEMSGGREKSVGQSGSFALVKTKGSRELQRKARRAPQVRARPKRKFYAVQTRPNVLFSMHGKLSANTFVR